MSDYMDTPHYRVNKFVSTLRVMASLQDREGRIYVANGIPLTLDDLEAVIRESAARMEYAEQLQRAAVAFLARAVRVGKTATEFAALMDSDELFDLRGSLSINSTDQRDAASREVAPMNSGPRPDSSLTDSASASHQQAPLGVCNSEEAERVAFEKWYEHDDPASANPDEHGRNLFARDPTYGDSYENPFVDAAWCAWIARAEKAVHSQGNQP